jgi:uncharacterized membrane protein
MGNMGKIFNRIFVDGMGGMTLGIFSTLILGTIIGQIGSFVNGHIGEQLIALGTLLIGLTGAGIGCGVAVKLKEDALVVLSAAIAGMIGAYSDKILAGGNISFHSNMNLIIAFLAAYVATEVGHFLSGRTKLDLIVIPIPSILLGGGAAILVTPFSAKAMSFIVDLIQWGTEQNHLLMGVVIAVIMGILSILPVHMAAFGIMISLSGEAAGAATIGCCASMVGFAVASFRENGIGGFLAQGFGSSVLQLPNVLRKPIIWIPTILTSAILGPIGTLDWFHMVNNKIGAVMGSTGLIGQVMAYRTMIKTDEMLLVIIKIVALHLVVPGILAYGIAEFMRKNRWIKNGDMKIHV